ncbi:MAG: hypothetical protein ACR2OJ_17830 [Hyphomicrobiales bacterium]
MSFPEGEPEGWEIVTRYFSGDPTITTLTLTTDPSLKALDSAMPKKLANLAPPRPQEAKRTREFQPNMGEEGNLAVLAASWGNICGVGGMGINGQPMNM